MPDLSREELHNSLEIIETRMDARIGSLEQRMDTKFAQVDARFEQIDQRFEKMDARFEKMEARFENIDGRLASMDTNIHKTAAETIKWVIGSAIAMAAAGITVITFVLNYGVPRAPAQALAPIILQVPAYAFPAAPAAVAPPPSPEREPHK